MVSWFRLIRYASSAVLANWGKTLIASGVVAIGVAAVSFQQAYLQGLLNAPMAFLNTQGPLAARIAYVVLRQPRGRPQPVRPLNLDDVAHMNASVAPRGLVSGWLNPTVKIVTPEMVVEGSISALSGALLEAFRPEVVVGNCVDENDVVSSVPVAMISERQGRRLFPSGEIVGRRLRVEGIPLIIKGVLKSSPEDQADSITLFVPLDFAWRRLPNGGHLSGMILYAYPPASVAEVEALVNNAREAFRTARGISAGDDDGLHWLTPEWIVDSFRKEAVSRGFLPMYWWMSAVGMVLALAGVANVMSLRARQRRKEVAIQRALGATRRQIFLGTIFEAVLIAFGGLALGWVTTLGTVAIVRWWPHDAPYSAYRFIGLSPSFFLIPAACAVVVASLAAVLPGVRLSRMDAAAALRRG